MDPFIDIHTHKAASDGHTVAVKNVLAGELSKKLFSEKGFFSVGFHPWEIKADMKAAEMFQTVEPHLSNSNVVLIGEAGLDRSINASFELQTELFRLHIKASEELKKPLIIHCVRAFSDLLEIRKSVKPKMPWIIHGYHSNVQVLEQLLMKEFYISFGQALLHDEQKFRKLLLLVPKPFLLFETDESDFDIEIIYNKAAALLNLSKEELAQTVFRNAQKLLPL
jgi:TatD DNase family protein